MGPDTEMNKRYGGLNMYANLSAKKSGRNLASAGAGTDLTALRARPIHQPGFRFQHHPPTDTLVA
jgi:hypothetical protein